MTLTKQRWTIEFTEGSDKDLSKLDPEVRKRILIYFHQRVLPSEDPRQFGKALTGRLRGPWSYRIGDYRAIAFIQDQRLVIAVVEIGHRREVYES